MVFVNIALEYLCKTFEEIKIIYDPFHGTRLNNFEESFEPLIDDRNVQKLSIFLLYICRYSDIFCETFEI